MLGHKLTAGSALPGEGLLLPAAIVVLIYLKAWHENIPGAIPQAPDRWKARCHCQRACCTMLNGLPDWA